FGKFRIVMPLAAPWRATDYADQKTANAAWKAAVISLAAHLDVEIDEKCTNAQSFLFMPRPPPGAVPETFAAEGAPVDIFRLPAAGGDDPFKDRAGMPVSGSMRKWA